MRYAGVAELVHPGPHFSDDDERDEIGIAGQPVGGIARLFLAIGRFAIAGEIEVENTIAEKVKIQQYVRQYPDRQGGGDHVEIWLCVVESIELRHPNQPGVRL